MFRSTKVIKRHNISIPFYHEAVPELDDDYRREFFIRYVQTGKFLRMEKKLLDAGLTLEIITEWDNSESFKEYSTEENEHIEKFNNESNSYIICHGLLEYYILEEIE